MNLNDLNEVPESTVFQQKSEKRKAGKKDLLFLM